MTVNDGSFFVTFARIVFLAAVLIMAVAWTVIWIRNVKKISKSKKYCVIIYDIFGKETSIDGLRVNFTVYDVAWSFIKEYKRLFPLHNFALISQDKSEQKMIVKYL